MLGLGELTSCGLVDGVKRGLGAPCVGCVLLLLSCRIQTVILLVYFFGLWVQQASVIPLVSLVYFLIFRSFLHSVTSVSRVLL
jgi:hypothetical protein